MSSLGNPDSPHALCVTSNLALRKTLQRTLNAGGTSVEFVEALPSGDSQRRAQGAMLFIDRACSRTATPVQLTQIIGEAGRVIILGDSLENEAVVELLRTHRVNHVISDDEKLDESELVITSVKLSSGDIFGLEKYLAWGARVRSLEIDTYEAKRDALSTVTRYAREVGARRHVIAKIESVSDELLMNALYDAPAAENSHATQPAQKRQLAPEDLAVQRADELATMKFACDGRYFAVSVQDNYGRLHKDTILDHLVRARNERGAPRLDNSSVLGGNSRTNTGNQGAGLGLYFILSSVTRFIANIDEGVRTEVVCLFDWKERGRQASSCARSLHIFTT